MKILSIFYISVLFLSSVAGTCETDVKVLDPQVNLGWYNCSEFVPSNPGCEKVIKNGKIRCTLIRKENMYQGKCYYHHCTWTYVDGWKFRAYVDHSDYNTIQILVRPKSKSIDFIFLLFLMTLIAGMCYLCMQAEERLPRHQQRRYDRYHFRDNVYQ